MSYKYSLDEEDIKNDRFNIEIYYNIDENIYYFIIQSLILDCYVEREINNDSIIKECKYGVSLLNDITDEIEQKMRDWLLYNTIPSQTILLKWLVKRQLIIIEDKKSYLTYEIKPQRVEEDPYYIQPDPVIESQRRIDILRDYYESTKLTKEKVYVVDHVMQDAAQNKIPTITFNMDEVEKAAKISGACIIIYIKIVCRPRFKVEPSLQYIHDCKLDKEKVDRLTGKAKSVIKEVNLQISNDELEFNNQIRREAEEEMRLLNV